MSKAKRLSIILKLTQITKRLQSLLPILSGEPLKGSLLKVTEAIPVKDKDGSKLNALLQLTSEEGMSLNLHVEASSITELSVSCAKFNMCSAHSCSIGFKIGNDNTLEIEFIAPTEESEKMLYDFFELASAPVIS